MGQLNRKTGPKSAGLRCLTPLLSNGPLCLVNSIPPQSRVPTAVTIKIRVTSLRIEFQNRPTTRLDFDLICTTLEETGRVQEPRSQDCSRIPAVPRRRPDKTIKGAPRNIDTHTLSEGE